MEIAHRCSDATRRASSKRIVVSTCHRQPAVLTLTATDARSHVTSLHRDTSSYNYSLHSLAASNSGDGAVSRMPGASSLHKNFCRTIPALGQSSAELYLLVARNYTAHHTPSPPARNPRPVHLVPVILHSPSLVSFCVREEICTSTQCVVSAGSGYQAARQASLSLDLRSGNAIAE